MGIIAPNFSVRTLDNHLVEIINQGRRDLENEVDVTDKAICLLQSEMCSEAKVAKLLGLHKSTLSLYLKRRSKYDSKFSQQLCEIKKKSFEFRKQKRAAKARLRAKLFREKRQAFLLLDELEVFRIHKKTFRVLKISVVAFRRWTMSQRRAKSKKPKGPS